MPPWELVLGTGGVAVVAITAVVVLWRAHTASDKREQDRADKLDERLDKIADALSTGLTKADPK